LKNLVKKRLCTVAAFTLWGVVIGAVLGPIIGQFDERQLFFSGVRGVAIGLLIGVGLGVGEEFILPRWSRTMAFARLSVVRIGGYTLMMITALTAVNAVDRSIVLVSGLGALKKERGHRPSSSSRAAVSRRPSVPCRHHHRRLDVLLEHLPVEQSGVGPS